VGIPTLEEVLDVTRGRVGVMAELKSAYLYRPHHLVRRTVALQGLVYTVNDDARMRDLVDAGVDGIFTDRPAALRAVLRA
jgi:glycerophosphoryl diester phosphodiesterase